MLSSTSFSWLLDNWLLDNSFDVFHCWCTSLVSLVGIVTLVLLSLWCYCYGTNSYITLVQGFFNIAANDEILVYFDMLSYRVRVRVWG